jgi:hypothetical protein
MKKPEAATAHPVYGLWAVAALAPITEQVIANQHFPG